MSSNTRGSLRRSGRSPKKAVSDYAVGDLVALVRNGTATRARLLELLTVASSSNPRWLIRFEGSPPGQNSKDEEVYEHTFVGKVTTTDQPQESANTTETEAKESIDSAGKNSPPASDTGSTSSRGTGRSGQRTKNSPPSSHQQEQQQQLPEAAEESSSVREEGDGAPSPSASDASAARLLSAREARVRRRQGAVFAPDKPILDRKNSISSSLHNTNNSSNNNNNNKRKLTGAAKMAAAKKKREKEEDCVKIKFLTGTLYLYRGERRRAEFVRRV